MNLRGASGLFSAIRKNLNKIALKTSCWLLNDDRNIICQHRMHWNVFWFRFTSMAYIRFYGVAKNEIRALFKYIWAGFLWMWNNLLKLKIIIYRRYSQISLIRIVVYWIKFQWGFPGSDWHNVKIGADNGLPLSRRLIITVTNDVQVLRSHMTSPNFTNMV